MKMFIVGLLLCPIWVFLFLRIYDLYEKRKKSSYLSNKKKEKYLNIETTDLLVSEHIPNIIHELPVKSINFNVAGVTKENNEGNNIQSIIEQIAREYFLAEDAYGGMTNREIIEYYSFGERVYEIEYMYEYDNISFIREADNEYDQNAIKVVHREYGHLGYVPKSKNVKMGEIIFTQKYDVCWKVVGGKYKYVDMYEDKVKIKKDKYGVNISIHYK